MGWRYDTPEGVHDDDTRAVWDESADPPTKIRDYTAEEQAYAQARAEAAAAQAQAQAVAATLTADAAADLPKVEQAIADLLALLADNSTPGSIRHWRGTVVTNQYSASTMRALADLLLANVVANRRLARQVARLTRQVNGLLDTADVGDDAT